MVTINADSVAPLDAKSLSRDDHLAYCQSLAAKISSVNDLPVVCQRYPSVIQSLKTDGEKVDPFLGMKSRTSARAARNKGRENYAQIQRRFTQSHRRFSKQPQNA